MSQPTALPPATLAPIADNSAITSSDPGRQQLAGCNLSVGIAQRPRANAALGDGHAGPLNPLNALNRAPQSGSSANMELDNAVRDAEDDLDAMFTAARFDTTGMKPQAATQFRKDIENLRLQVLGRILDTDTGCSHKITPGKLDFAKSTDEIKTLVKDAKSNVECQSVAGCRNDQQSINVTSRREIQKILTTNFGFTAANARKFLRDASIPHHDNLPMLKSELQELARTPKLVTDVSNKYEHDLFGGLKRLSHNNALKVDNIRELLTARQSKRFTELCAHVEPDHEFSQLPDLPEFSETYPDLPEESVLYPDLPDEDFEGLPLLPPEGPSVPTPRADHVPESTASAEGEGADNPIGPTGHEQSVREREGSFDSVRERDDSVEALFDNGEQNAQAAADDIPREGAVTHPDVPQEGVPPKIAAQRKPSYVEAVPDHPVMTNPVGDPTLPEYRARHDSNISDVDDIFDFVPEDAGADAVPPEGTATAPRFQPPLPPSS